MSVFTPQFIRRAAAWLSASLLAGGVALAQPPLRFATEGGDAWTFSKTLTGSVAPGACDGVRVEGPRGRVAAWAGDGRFRAEVPLLPGANSVRALCTRDGQVVAQTPPQQWNLRLPDTPRAWLRLRAAPEAILLDAGGSRIAPGQPAPLVRYAWRAEPGNPGPLLTAADEVALGEGWVEGEQLQLQAPAVAGEYRLRLRVTDALGRVDESVGMFRVENGTPVEVDLESEHPAWVDSAVVYGVVPFFFGPGGFRDVTARLDEIAGLGATVAWLSPVNASPEDDFGYAVKNHFRLRETFGPPEDFRQLVDRAHQLGLKVIMDFVPNHVSDRHPYYLDTLVLGRRSPYYDWFERDADGEVTQYFDWDNLKNLNYDNPEVQNYIIAAFAYWVREYGVDGFRVDAGWGVRERAPEFWERWREELKRLDPDLLLLAEASARDPYYVANGFDAAYDWSAALGEWAWQDVFKEDGEGVDLPRLREALGAARELPADTLIFRFLNNNDTGDRFISRFGPGVTRVAATLLFTLPGVPLIYTGDEIGAEFEPYDEGPPLVWRDRHGLLPLYTMLARVRREHPVLWGRELRLVANSREDAVLSYLRPAEPPADPVLVVLNFTGDPVDVALRPPAEAVGERMRNLLSGALVEFDPESPRLDLPAYGVAVLQPAARR